MALQSAALLRDAITCTFPPPEHPRITFSAFRYRNNQRGLSLRAGHVAPVSWFINGAGWHGGEITVANDSNRPRRSLVENPGMKNESRRGGIKLPETRCSPVPTYQREHASPGQLINDPYPLWIFIRRGVNERKTALVERDDWRLAVLFWNICSEEARKLIITPRVMILARIQSYEELI